MRLQRARLWSGLSPSVVAVLALAAGAGAAEEPFVFRDVAGETGVADALKGARAHAAAWGDADGDGRLDLFVGTFAEKGRAAGEQEVPNVFLWKDGGRFVVAKVPALRAAGRGTGAVLADLNNDGLLDLYVVNHTRPGDAATTAPGHRNILYKAGPGRTFEDVSQVSGAVPQDFTGRNVGVLDYDGDGLLDLLLVHAGGAAKGPAGARKSLLLRNLGEFRFEVANQKAGMPDDVVGLGAAVGDVNDDGWPDLFIGGSNRLFLSQGKGTFREATELKGMLDWGFKAEDDAPSAGGAFGDFDRDGRPDLLIGHHPKRPWTKPVPLRLFRNLGCTRDRAAFEEVTEKVGLAGIPMKAPHVEIRDFDNDGWPDLYASVFVFKGDRVYPLIYRNLGAAAPGALPKFRETALVHRPDFPDEADRTMRGGSGPFYEKLLRERKINYTATGPSADFDGDGRLDLLLASWWPQQPAMLLKNETRGGNWLDVTVAGSQQHRLNSMGIGCKVLAYRTGQAGTPEALLASEEIATGYGYTCGQPAIAHLGLGKNATCDVVVELPFGQGKVVRREVKANQALRVVPPAAGR